MYTFVGLLGRAPEAVDVEADFDVGKAVILMWLGDRGILDQRSISQSNSMNQT
jgi:hypothetical protein